MATLATIRDFVREQTLLEIDDWANDKLNNVINEGVLEVSSRFRWPWLAASANLSVTATVQEYALSTIDADLAQIAAIVDNNRKVKLQEVTPHYVWELEGGDPTDAAEANVFYLWGDSVFLHPVPNTTEADAYKVFFYKRPTLLTNDASVPQWDSQFHMVVAFYAIARVWEREEDFEKAKSWRDQFNERLEQMARFYLNRADDHPIIVGGGKLRQLRGDINLPLA